MTAVVRHALAVAVGARVPVLLWGGPGIGKTSAVREMADASDLPCEAVIASIREPSDFAGLPIVGGPGEGVTLAPPRWAERLVTAGRGVLFLDEISTAPPAVQAALLRVVLERAVGDLELPEGVAVIAAANPPDQAADGWDLAAALANRFCHLEWTLDAREWADGLLGGFTAMKVPTFSDEDLAARLPIAQSMVSAFVVARPALMNAPPSDASAAGLAWPSPRAWTMTARLLAAADLAEAGDEVAATLAAGCVGTAPATEFLAWSRDLELQDPEAVLVDPDSFELPPRGDRAYAALASLIGAVLGNNTPDRWEAAWRAIAVGVRDGKADLAVASVRTLVQNRPDGAMPPPDVLAALAPVLRTAGMFEQLTRRMSGPHDLSPTGFVDYDATRLAAARLRAVDAQPFLALALFALSPVAAPGKGTFGVDEQWRLFVDPEVLDRWTIEESAAVLLHEVGHVVRDHVGRARQLAIDEDTHVVWNIAADAEINDDLRGDQISLPDAGIFPETIGQPPGKPAEYYYVRIIDRPPEDLPEVANCGSGCHGVHDPEEDLEPALALALAEQPGLDATEKMLMRRRVAEAVLIWAKGRHPGALPGGWARWAEGIIEPRVDWKHLLHGSVRRAIGAVSGAADYSYRRPSRRRVPGVVLPSLVRPLPRAAVVIDTSGSVSNALLNVAWSEVRACLRSLGVRRDLLTVWAGDVAVARVKSVMSQRVDLPGGGGTDMAAAIETVCAARPLPDIIVVITDGETPWPRHPPRARVVVALLEGDPQWTPPPAWAQVVHISEDDAVVA